MQANVFSSTLSGACGATIFTNWYFIKWIYLKRMKREPHGIKILTQTTEPLAGVEYEILLSSIFLFKL